MLREPSSRWNEGFGGLVGGAGGGAGASWPETHGSPDRGADADREVALAKDGEYLTSRHLSKEIAAVTPDKPDALTKMGPVIDGETLKEKVESLEKILVTEALARFRWNQSEAARELGLSRVGLANKIKRYDLHHQN